MFWALGKETAVTGPNIPCSKLSLRQ